LDDDDDDNEEDDDDNEDDDYEDYKHCLTYILLLHYLIDQSCPATNITITIKQYFFQEDLTTQSYKPRQVPVSQSFYKHKFRPIINYSTQFPNNQGFIPTTSPCQPKLL